MRGWQIILIRGEEIDGIIQLGIYVFYFKGL